MDFSRESSADCDGFPLVFYWTPDGEEPSGVVCRKGFVWQCKYWSRPEHVSYHDSQHEAEMQMCEILLGA